MVNVPCALVGPVIKVAVKAVPALFLSLVKTLPVKATGVETLATIVL